MQKQFVRLSFLIVTTVILPAQDPDDVAREAQASKNASVGKAQFGQTCGFCHGVNARGASGPDLIHSALVSHDLDGNLIGPVVLNGRPEKGMPAFQLSDSQIRSIASYLHAEAKLASTTYQRGPGEYPVEKLLVGNAVAGKEYFGAKCSSCHSVSGNLAHIASKYKPIDLQSRIAFPSGIKPTVSVTEPSGKITTGTEVYADEFVISLREKNNWILTFDRKLVEVTAKDPLDAHVQLLSNYSDADLHNLFAFLETLK